MLRLTTACRASPPPPLPAPCCSTLRFACRAKRVVNNATVNEVVSDAAVLKRQAHEIEELRKLLEGTGWVGVAVAGWLGGWV